MVGRLGTSIPTFFILIFFSIIHVRMYNKYFEKTYLVRNKQIIVHDAITPNIFIYFADGENK